MAKVIVFTSAAKGVGKTHMIVNLALHLSDLGYRTCLFNSDSDTATIPELLGVQPQFSLIDVMRNRVRLDNVIVKGPGKLDFFPGYPGIEKLGTLEANDRDRLIRLFLDLNSYDFFFLDTFPGISRNVVAFCKASSQVVLVMTADQRSLTDTYLLLKALTVNNFEGSVRVLVNISRDVKVARRAYVSFKEAVSRYLPVTVSALGTVFEDLQVRDAGREKKPFISLHPNADASKCVFNIARHLSSKKGQDIAVSAFWVRFLQQLKQPFQISGSRAINFGKRSSGGGGDKSNFPEDGFIDLPIPESSPVAECLDRNPDDIDIYETLRCLSDRVAVITQDLKEIKRAVNGILKEDAGSKTVSEKPPKTNPDKIPLDFEAYLKMRKMNEQ